MATTSRGRVPDGVTLPSIRFASAVIGDNDRVELNDSKEEEDYRYRGEE